MSDITLYTLKEVAEILKVSRQTIYNYLKAGRLRATKFGKEYRVTREDLEQFVACGRNTPQPFDGDVKKGDRVTPTNDE